jgi:hypothetical protein
MTAEDKDTVIHLFDKAHAIAKDEGNYGTEKAQMASNTAFDAAKAAGWDWEADQKFVDWCLKATDLECITEGRKRFLEAIAA